MKYDEFGPPPCCQRLEEESRKMLVALNKLEFEYEALTAKAQGLQVKLNEEKDKRLADIKVHIELRRALYRLLDSTE